MSEPRPPKVLSIGAVRRIRALAVAGYSVVKVAEAAGIPHKTVAELLDRPTCFRATAEHIDATYRLLIDVPPPTATKEDRQVVSRMKNQAAYYGWTPLEEGDPATPEIPCHKCGGERDARRANSRGGVSFVCRACVNAYQRARLGGAADPDWVVVQRAIEGAPVTLNRAERRAVVLKMAKRGMSEQHTADVLGVKRQSVNRMKLRLRAAGELGEAA